MAHHAHQLGVEEQGIAGEGHHPFIQLAHVDLASDIEAVLRETGLAASSLKLEITESAYIGDVRAAEATLRRMQSIGIEWSIDDLRFDRATPARIS
jgi:EAL domain-containing protein (putative c-di-GMP-specific phosphodiesterase class I)